MKAVAGSVLTPVQVAAALAEQVIGQSEAVREMSIALVKKLAKLRVGNILMVGSSGSGKTTLMRAVEGYLQANPELAVRSTVVRIHANVLGEEAERGHPGGALLRRLLERAREQLGRDCPVEQLLERARHGLVFVDEVDKIRSHVGDQPHVRGIRAQEALLTLMENESVPFELPDWAGGGLIQVDSSTLLFVCGGAFEGLYDAVYDRITIGEDRGSLKPVTVVDGGEVRVELPFSLREWLRNQDLFQYGLSPQFLSRFDAVVLLHELGVDELIKIFLDKDDSGYRQALAYFESQGIQFAISPAAVREIATQAVRERRLGARALKEVFRRVIRDYEFDPAKAVLGAGQALMIDLPEVTEALERNWRGPRKRARS